MHIQISKCRCVHLYINICKYAVHVHVLTGPWREGSISMVVGAQEKPEVVFGTRPVVWMMLGAKCECSICSPVPLPIKSIPRNCGDLRHLNSRLPINMIQYGYVSKSGAPKSHGCWNPHWKSIPPLALSIDKRPTSTDLSPVVVFHNGDKMAGKYPMFRHTQT